MYKKSANTWKNFTTSNSGIVSNRVNDIEIDGDYVWFTTFRGISRYQKSMNKWTTFDSSNSGLPHNYVNRVIVDGDYIWFGTEGGVSRYQKSTTKWVTFNTTNSALKSNLIAPIGVDNNFIWFTGGGYTVMRFEKSSGIWHGFDNSNSGISHGILGRSHCCEVDKNFVWFGACGGVSIYDRRDNTFLPQQLFSKPASVVGLEAKRENKYIALSWQQPESDGGLPISNHKIYRGFRPGYEKLLTTTDNVLTYRDKIVSGHTIYFYKVSATNKVGEDPLSNEIQIDIELPDLVMLELTTDPIYPKAHEKTMIIGKFKNNGTGNTSNIILRFYCDGTPLSEKRFSDISPGDDESYEFLWNATEGNHTLGVKIDLDNLIDELDEENNEIYIYINVPVKTEGIKAKFSYIIMAIVGIVTVEVIVLFFLYHHRGKRW